MRPEGSRGRSAKVSVPLGTPDNSPAFQRWVGLREGEFRPVGTVEITGKRPTDYFSRAYGTSSTSQGTRHRSGGLLSEVVRDFRTG